MARTRFARHPKSESNEPEAESPETAESSTETATKTISKSAAVRAAIAEGIESLDDMAAFIKDRYGIDMAKPHISAVKSNFKKKESETKAAEKREALKRRERPALTDYFARASKPRNGEVDFEDISSLKNLVNKLGADQVRKIIGLFE